MDILLYISFLPNLSFCHYKSGKIHIIQGFAFLHVINHFSSQMMEGQSSVAEWSMLNNIELLEGAQWYQAKMSLLKICGKVRWNHWIHLPGPDNASSLEILTQFFWLTIPYNFYLKLNKKLPKTRYIKLHTRILCANWSVCTSKIEQSMNCIIYLNNR